MNETKVLSKEAIKALADAVVEYMKDRIAKIEPEDDPTAEYSEYWTEGRYESDDCVGPEGGEFEDYSVSFSFEVTWKYREWYKYWSDPWCSPKFCDMKDMYGEVWGLEVVYPEGVPQSASKEIAEIVNREINR